MRLLPALVPSVAPVKPAKHAGGMVTAHARHRQAELKPEQKPKMPTKTATISKVKGPAAASRSRLQSAAESAQTGPSAESLLTQVRQQAARGALSAMAEGARATAKFDGDLCERHCCAVTARPKHADPSAFIVQLFASTEVSAAWQKRGIVFYSSISSDKCCCCAVTKDNRHGIKSWSVSIKPMARHCVVRSA